MRPRTSLVVLTLALAASAASCTAARDAFEGHKDAVARVDGYTLTIEHAARLLAAADEKLAPPEPSIVDPLTDLWIGYTLLASELASPDTFSDVDLLALTQFNLDQELVWMMRDDRIMSRVIPDESALREMFEEEQPYTSVRAYHILIQVPDTATAAEIDSLKRVADELRERALAGESFEELAKKHSQDPATAAKGGDLGWVSKGRLVPELEDAVLRMQPGEISETLRSSLGFHIVKVTERNAPDFDSIRDEYRLLIVGREVTPLEQAFIDSLFEAADVRFTDGAVSLVRRMVYDPRLERLTAAERNTVLARYRGGELTLGEWAHFVIRRSPHSRRAFSADSAAVDGYLRELIRNELLVKAARDLGYALPKAKADSVRESGKRDLHTAAAVSGLRRSRLVSGEETVPEAVDRILNELLTRQRSPSPLERVTPALKPGHTIQVYPDRFPAVIERLVALREEQTREGGAAEATEQPEAGSGQ
jgi:hypothetical protein